MDLLIRSETPLKTMKNGSPHLSYVASPVAPPLFTVPTHIPPPLFPCLSVLQVDLLIRSESPLKTMEKDVIKMLVTEMKEAGINIIQADVRKGKGCGREG